MALDEQLVPSEPSKPLLPGNLTDSPKPLPGCGNQPGAIALRLLAKSSHIMKIPALPPRPRAPLLAMLDGAPDGGNDHVNAPLSQMQRRFSMPSLSRHKRYRPQEYCQSRRLAPIVTKINHQCPQSSLLHLPQPHESLQTTATSSYVNSASPLALTCSTGQTSPASDVISLKSIQSTTQPQCLTNERNAPAQHPGMVHQAIPQPIRNGCSLPPIQESPGGDPVNPLEVCKENAIISVALIEKVASTKIYFETLYNDKDFSDVSPRSLRRRQMEKTLYEATNLAPSAKAKQRRSFFRIETGHLRKLRLLKSRHPEDMRNSMETAGFEAIRILGKGSFGVVRLVREKNIHRSLTRHGANPVYAMKVIKKTEMLRNSQEGHLRAERDFLVSCAETSEWVVPLLASFQDLDHLYLVMEYEIGGDFLGLLLRKTIISEPAARFYIAEMILCIEEAHRMKWIHRDVKPDNFLISASGHLKISDFGLAFDGHWSHNQAYYNDHRYSLLERFGVVVDGDEQDCNGGQPPHNFSSTSQFFGGERDLAGRFKIIQGRNNRRKLAKSVVGTSQYMAPEVVRGCWYDGRCDWWSIGIILFECLWGYTPFCREDREATKKAILEHGKLFMLPPPDQDVSTIAQDLIFRLLQEPELRLCSNKYTKNDFRRDLRCVPNVSKGARDYRGHHVYADDAEDIRRHPFFHGINWENILKLTPPWVPRVNTGDSTKYFDSEEHILGDSSVESMGNPDEKSLQTGAATPDERRAAVGGMDGQRMHKVQKPKRRPRDKLLRDPTLCKTVMEARKQRAFLGYTYRRPKKWVLLDEGTSEDQTSSSRSRDTEGDTIMGGC
ncbi:hypothetical protein FH972_023392 [Carpinus fangiana]|uniref:non-specific serine/threonine protein kinase n=1 Tax=Carpinus fangiana TaxID=176857 RepID=A0A5N6KVN8_9ROSI|nr:hypothetical protein FH972_023392 [Carpinus fangiana]